MNINQKSRFSFIRYANVWEDADILCEALAPTCQHGRILSIASSGDNVLALLTLNPKEIVAVDLSSPQLACLEIRMAAFRELDYSKLCEFLGVLPSQNRVEIYQNLLKPRLSINAAKFWDKRLSEICNGIIHAGKFERYLRLFGKWVLPLVQTHAMINELLKAKSEQERTQFYEEKWDHWRWRLLFKIFFSRFVMGHAGRDPSFFNHVEGTVGSRILDRSKHALTECSTHQNPFLHYILKGNFSNAALPCYLRPEHFNTIQSRIDRIKLIQGPVTQVEGCFDAFNLSDIFEYMNEEAFEACYKRLLEMANPNARLAYWNMLVPRRCPKSCRDQTFSLTALADSLHKNDKAWFYQKFVIEQRLP
jgi:S-adenosylmethionine-diacylglycerol 3-amino-3-carboxypropyl transferase